MTTSAKTNKIQMDDPLSKAIEPLLTAPPFGLSEAEKGPILKNALLESYRHHFKNCASFQRYCVRRNLRLDSTFEAITDFPFLPVQAFKENASLLSSVENNKIRTTIQSSATSGVPSSVPIDQLTSKRQIRALASVMSTVLGPRRRPFLVMDVDPRVASGAMLGARGAAVRGFLNLARCAEYVMSEQADGTLSLLEDKFTQVLSQYALGDQPVVVFGFTYVLYIYGIKPLRAAKKRFQLPVGSSVIHIGGWKKLEGQKVSKAEFNAHVAEAFGINTADVIDFYGFSEQIGVTYPDDPSGIKHAPAFAEVIVRDPDTYAPLPDGTPGLLQFMTPIPHSYPGFSVLTDDIGVIEGRSEANSWHGTQFRIIGRAKKAEVRGCGDIMAEKVSRPKAVSTQQADSKSESASISAQRPQTFCQTTMTPNEPAYLLFEPERSHCPPTLEAGIALEKLPTLKNLSELATKLKAGRERLDQYSVDELIALVSAAAQRWADPQSPLAVLRQQGLLFLQSWCQSQAMRITTDRALSGHRGYLDGPRPLGGTNRRLLMAVPRGLVVHWLAGNVPLLGMLALAQSIVTRNANLLKAASTFSSVLPLLLDAFRGLELELPTGRVVRGDDVLASIAVVYFSSNNLGAATAISEAADVRIAWGGREAVEAITNLPKRYSTDDVIFGPKLSYMVIGKEVLSEQRKIRKLVRRAATDGSVFDQYACASPHTIFVERGSKSCSPRQFAEMLAEEMARASIRIPKMPVDAGTAANIASTRMHYEFVGDLWASEGTEWTVCYDEAGADGLAAPIYSRVLTVRAIDDAMDAARFAHAQIQTIGLALNETRRLAFAQEAAARGAERFPEIGRMTLFDSPWDGMFLMSRLVRWVSVGGPY